MKRFIKHITIFSFLALIAGEIVVRLTHAMSDIPQRTIDNYGIQKYIPNQDGYWKGGDHKWLINEMGWPGELPERFDDLILVIGDSYIENFMNPNECHQSVYLKEQIPDHNFMEAARSGVSLIEAMEIHKQLDSLQPKHTLIYVNDFDFFESIVEVKPMSDITQMSLTNNEIVYGKMKAPVSKKILYNWKLLYYFYNRFPINLSFGKEKPKKIENEKSDSSELQSKDEVFKLIDHIAANYNLEGKSLVFHPNSNQLIIEKCMAAGFDTIILDSSNDKDWTFDYDSHWTCYGHKKVAEQVSKALKDNILLN
ncbi:hypothetical protein [Winogradskyella tangerina]|uniref:hypothetical protein n=1 Tax=Winogradskyella tangerina TaxID=2023240 RepID=UPI000DBE010B|nr:hypothetical protein [Winogradskyella tangerina]